MRICLVFEGSYPYVHGGVSSWAHDYITALSEHEFVLWTVGASSADRGSFVYDLPANVVQVHEVFLDDALHLGGFKREVRFTAREMEALRALVHRGDPSWEVLVDLFQRKGVHPLAFLQSRAFMDLFCELCREEYPYVPFADAFHATRSMLLPVLYLLSGEVPRADAYHAVSTGYGGLLACLGSIVSGRPMLLTEHGIYTREREEEIIRADWVAPAFKGSWIRFFSMLSEQAYARSFRVTSLFSAARALQVEMGCEADRCLVVPNGIRFERFCSIEPKPDDGWVDIAAVVRLAPIKDVKTLIYAFFELEQRVERVRLHILGGVDDEDYADECHALVEQLGVRNAVFAGRVDVARYLEGVDFTVLSSISEGQPLSVLESLAAARPCVTTEVGCCRELLEGGPGDEFGTAGFVVPPMYRKGLADALERMCESRRRRLEMGRIGRARIEAFYRHEDMVEGYRALYRETERVFGAGDAQGAQGGRASDAPGAGERRRLRKPSHARRGLFARRRAGADGCAAGTDGGAGEGASRGADDAWEGGPSWQA